MRCPVTKFITHTTSHICFLILLAAATFRITESGETITSTTEINETKYAHLSSEEKIQNILKETLRPASTLITHVQICIVFWILGLLWIECKQVYISGARAYTTDYYNFIDFSVLSMYLASYVLRFFTEYQVAAADRTSNGTNRARELLMQQNHTYFHLLVAEIKNPNHKINYFMEASRFHWEANDPEIVSDVLFAIANVISFARTTYLMPAFEVLGPLQISLGRMIGDITRFMVLFTLVLFAFMVGLHNLYWYYGAQKIKMEINGNLVSVHAAKAFQGLRQTFYSLFWSMFGQVSMSDITVMHPEPDGVFKSTLYGSSHHDSSTSIVESVGMYLFGIYHVVIIIVLINMLIAMMSHSFEDIQTDCDVEWKFARTKLWLNYMDEGSTLPVPFNMIPTPKSFYYVYIFFKDLIKHSKNGFLDYEKNRKQTFLKKRRETVCKTLDLKPDETSYIDIMHRLVKRYLFKLERAKDDTALKDMGNIRAEEVEFIEAPDVPPPPIPGDTPSRIPFATPPIPEEEGEDNSKADGRASALSKRKASNRSHHTRRTSMANVPMTTTLAIPQLDAIQRSQKLLDVRLQHLQANSKENNRLQDDVEFIRKLMTENQKALCNVVQALANIQGEIVNLAQCLKPAPRPQSNAIPNAHGQTNAVSSNRASRKRSGPEEDDTKV